MRNRRDDAFVLWYVASLLVISYSAVFPNASSNEVCKDHFLEKDLHVTCSFRVLVQDLQIANLTNVANDGVVRLSLVCDEEVHNNLESVLTPLTLSGFQSLKELSVEFCKISELQNDAFKHLSALRNLTFRTRSSDWAVVSLTADPAAFRPLQQLERLDLSTNNIWELPNGAFCSLGLLKSLNLSHNHLQDLTQLGFAGSVSAGNKSILCRSKLSLIDLSYNDVDVLVAGAFRGLGLLQRLFIHNNNIGKIDDNAFEELRSLQVLDISDNKLVAIPEDAFIHTPRLMYYRAKNNSLSVLAPGLFRGLEHLVELDLSMNDLKSEWLTDAIFQGLIRLMILSLSHNQINKLNANVFRDMYSVQVLILSHNRIQDIPDSCFASCVNLHTLDLSYNRIQVIQSKAFSGVSVLSFLALDNNNISEVNFDAFSNLTSLEDLNLNGNSLSAVPEAIKYLQLLKTLDLGDNQITNLENLPVKDLKFLYGLRLLNNKVSGNISRETFHGIPSLKILNLAKNNINTIESGAFTTNRNLQAIRLDANLLTTVNGLFEDLPNLEWLNVSDNNIEIFDYHFIPTSLLWLDLHKNKIHELGNYLGRHDLRLNTLDASFNKIKHISSIQIPDSAQYVFLNDNRISVVEPFTFFKKENLTRVDLFANKLTKMEMSALRLTALSPGKRRPEFYLGGNSFICNCGMEWLQRINNLEHLKIYPMIMDLESIYCQMPFSRIGAFLPLVEVNPSQFLCQYESHCFALCHCCEFDACDCEMTCPDGCGCYHDQSWRSNIVDCSLHDLKNVPDRIPMDATEVYIDGNDLTNLSSHAFIGRKHLQVLYVNNSGIKLLGNETFSGLSRLSVLYLHDNFIEFLKGHEFKGLDMLKELYLHNNRLSYIHQHAFASLSHLETLTLHNNLLINFPVWRLVDNPYLVKVSLSDNLWTCDCQFIDSFEIWLSGSGRKVSNIQEIRCYTNDIDHVGTVIVDFNVSSCTNTTSSPSVRVMNFERLLHPVIAIVVAFVFIILLVVSFMYRNTLRVWVYSRCGCRLCHSKSTSDERDKLFDAFVSYSSKDEAWVNQVLAVELEGGDKPYRICLHYRDFPVTAYIAETIVEAVESSKRTIIVLSKNFIENEWCRFQFKSAHHEVLKKRRKRLIVIVLGEIPARDLDPDLRLYLKTNTCINTSDKLFWDKLRFAMPDTPAAQRVVHTYSTIPDRTGASKYGVNGSTPLHPSHHFHSAQRPASDPYWA